MTMQNKMKPEALAKGPKLSSEMRLSFDKIAESTGYSARQVRRDHLAGEFTFADLMTLSTYILASPKGQASEAVYGVPASEFPPQQLPK